MTFTYNEMAELYGTSRTTFWRHLKKINFKKSGQGELFNETDAKALSQVLGFSIPALNVNAPQTAPKQPVATNQIDLEASIKEIQRFK